MNSELVALRGTLYSKSFRLKEGDKIVVGRGGDADIQILDGGLSRHHCYIEKVGNDFYITDLSSRNGTWVNDERVEQHKLEHGDKVRFAGVEFEFRPKPDRRRRQADLIAAIPEMPSGDLAQRVELDGSGLMALPSEFESIENFRRVQRDLATIYRVGNLISGGLDLESLYERILDAIFEVVHSDRAFLIMADPETGKLKAVAKHEKKPLTESEAVPTFSSTVVREVRERGASVLRADALTDDRYAQAESVLFQNIHSVIAVPVESPDEILGVIYADTVAECEAFTKHDLELLTAVGKQAGVAVQRAMFAVQLEQLLRSTVRALVATIDAKDMYTRGHSERVTAYALRIGTAAGLKERTLRTLELAGLLHDIGKIGVPESVLRKAGPLTDKEYEIIKEHPKLGESILRHIKGAKDIAEIVLHHHERWDGRGYPEGLAKEEPSLAARILAVADAFDAMGSQRPYRDRMAQTKVLEEIGRCAGSQFDPALVNVLLRECKAGRISLDPKDTTPPDRSGDV